MLISLRALSFTLTEGGIQGVHQPLKFKIYYYYFSFYFISVFKEVSFVENRLFAV